jgi:DNA-directed RNA polymerase I subunit RPA49
MAQKKRKRTEEESVPIPNGSDMIKVTQFGNEDKLSPVITVPFGVAASNIPLNAYVEKTKSTKWANQRLVLQSSDHPRMDYIADEDFGTGSDAMMDHYLGVYDPQTKELKLSKVRQLALRRTLRPTLEELAKEAEQKAWQSVRDLRYFYELLTGLSVRLVAMLLVLSLERERPKRPLQA